jgi:ADP-heptose:LPS heptosyltransferase
MKYRLQKFFFDGTSRFTARFPRAGSRVMDFAFLPLFDNPFLAAYATFRNRRRMNDLKAFRRFLVIPDIHIGDSVMTQAVLIALRDFFPEAHIDYLVNRITFPMIEGNPEANRIIPIFSGGHFPTPALLKALQDLVAKESYDLVLCCSPFIKDRVLRPRARGIINFLNNTPVLMGNERKPSEVNHFIFQMYRFTRDLILPFARPVRGGSFKGVRVSFSDAAADRARQFAAAAGLSPGVPAIFYNPDGASPYTRLPFEKQADLLGRLTRREFPVLLGAGHTEANIGERLRQALPPAQRAQVKIIPPELPLDVYVALSDACDVFVSGDTGPLHLAAAWKYSRTGRFAFRNRTAVLSIFGGTPSRMSGYDSLQPGYLAANQDAPSWCYTAGSPCRNITCLNKMLKTCRTVRCFEETDLESLARRIFAYMETRVNNSSERGERAAGS